MASRPTTASDDINLLPIDGGPGPDFLDKEWTPDDSVPALSGETRTARLWWSTDGLNISEMTLTDISETEDPENTVASVYDAFDLVRDRSDHAGHRPAHRERRRHRGVAVARRRRDGPTSRRRPARAAATASSAATRSADAQSADSAAPCGSSSPSGPPAPAWARRTSVARSISTSACATRCAATPSQWVLGNFHNYTYNTGQAGSRRQHCERARRQRGDGRRQRRRRRRHDPHRRPADQRDDHARRSTRISSVSRIPRTNVDPVGLPAHQRRRSSRRTRPRRACRAW